jgi:hypothetical protein
VAVLPKETDWFATMRFDVVSGFPSFEVLDELGEKPSAPFRIRMDVVDCNHGIR